MKKLFMFFIMVAVLMTSCKNEDGGTICGCTPPPPQELVLQLNNASDIIRNAVDYPTSDEPIYSELKNYFFWGEDDEGTQQRIYTDPKYYSDADVLQISSEAIYHSIADKGLTTLYFTIWGDIDTLQLDVKATGEGYLTYTVNQIKINDYVPEKRETDFNYQGVYLIKK